MTKHLKIELMSTGMMTSLMVLFMVNYHVLMANGFSDQFIWEFAQKYPITLIIAIILNLILIGPCVRYIFFKLIFNARWKSAPMKMNLTISTMVVLGMVTTMSIYGSLITFGTSNISWSLYTHTWIMNLLVALPVQLIIVGPLSRYLLNKIISILGL